MSVFTYICAGLSAGVVLGFAAGGLKVLFHRRPYSSRRVDTVRRIVGKAAAHLRRDVRRTNAAKLLSTHDVHYSADKIRRLWMNLRKLKILPSP